MHSLRPHRLLRLTRTCCLAAAACTLPLSSRSAQAEPRPIALQAATPEDAARALQHLLGAPVEVRGGEGRKITLNLPANTPPLKALGRVAAQMGGSWRMKLQVKAGRPESTRATPVIDHNVALGLQDVTASRAFSLVARDLKAELELEGDLEMRISAIVVNVTANILLDRIAEQAGATWDVSYVIDAPNVPQPIVVLPSLPAPVVTPPPAPMPEPVVLPKPRVASAAELRTELRGHINQIVRAEPARRAEAVREFLLRGEAMLLHLGALSPIERAERLRALATVVTPWRRLYQGLAPEVHKELAPVSALLARLLP